MISLARVLRLSRNSAILADALVPRLAAMLPVDRRNLFHLGTCCDPSAFTPAYFWNLVQGKEGLLFLVRNTKGFIFGCYVQDTFVPFGHSIQGHPSNVIFTLGSTTTPAVTFLQSPSRNINGVCMSSMHALRWGTAAICG
jgi:hypothetical protein